MSQIILQVQDLYKYFPYRYSIIDRLARRTRKVVRAVDGVSFSMQKGEILALVGESGSGKTTVGMNILGLQIPTKGQILFERHDVRKWASGTLKSSTIKEEDDLLKLNKRSQILALRRKSQMVFQDPYESLNPRQKVFDIISEPLDIHRLIQSNSEKSERVRIALEDSGLAPADHFWDRYPEELSGGQRQRVVIAGALVLEPDLLVADEPVSMLDVSIRAEILHLLKSLRLKRDISILYTTHDLATAGYFTDRMAVMYLGRIVELGPTKDVLFNPLHPYTKALISVIPAPNPRRRQAQVILEGEVPNPVDIPSGCRFHPRCPIAIDQCKVVDPPDVEVGKNGSSHKVSCLRVE
jgi:oligopeptide/dipeptide ABC transporter ATP-binding protein